MKSEKRQLTELQGFIHSGVNFGILHRYSGSRSGAGLQLELGMIRPWFSRETLCFSLDIDSRGAEWSERAAPGSFRVTQVGAEGGLGGGVPIFSPQVRLLHRKGSEEVVRPLL